MSILERVHSEFFELYDKQDRDSIPDVRVVESNIRGRTLKGCRIVFTGIIPTTKNPETSELWVKAQMFGAQCFRDLDPTITHLIAENTATEKAVRAIKSKSVHVVSLGWLLQSFRRWERLPEEDFYFPNVPFPTELPQPPKEEDELFDDDSDDSSESDD